MSESTTTIDERGIKRWKNSAGQFHREDGPAIERTNGDKMWRVNGKLHRKDGPAVEYSDGSIFWYLNDKFLGYSEEGFWNLWECLTPEQKKDHTLLAYLIKNLNI